MAEHAGRCPGLPHCDDVWHEGGCQPYWQYYDAGGNDISTHMYTEDDSVEKRLWEGPDGPSEVWIRAYPGDRWERDS